MIQNTFETWDFDNIWYMGEHETYLQLQYFTDCDKLISVEENPLPDETKINIYPNPFFHSLELSTSCPFGSKIQIINLLGVEIWNGKAMSERMKIGVSLLPSGVYFLRVGNMTKMFVKE